MDDYSHCTMSFEEYVARLCDLMSLKEVAGLVGLDWKTVKRIDKKHIQQTLTKLCDLSPTSIGVDEVAYEKGHKYLTIVRDVDTCRVIWVGEDRKQSTLDEFLTWKKNVLDSGLREFEQLLKTLDHYMYGILNYFKHRLTNAASEGFNNKINLVKRRAHGFRDTEYFKLKILKICGQ